MALKGFRPREEAARTGSGAMEAGMRPGQQTVHPVTRIDASSSLSGKLRCKGSVRLEGAVKGEIYSEQDVIVADSAEVKASIEALSVRIAGEVVGNVTARSKITLERTARVTGDLRTPGIVIEEGAKLEGRIDIGAEMATAQSKEAKADTAPRRPKPAAAPAPRPTV